MKRLAYLGQASGNLDCDKADFSSWFYTCKLLHIFHYFHLITCRLQSLAFVVFLAGLNKGKKWL